MKTKLLSFILVFAAFCSAFGQGKISFSNDSLHLFYWSPVVGNFLPGDEGLAGTGALGSPTPSGRTLVSYLYAGTSSDSLTLLTATTLSLSFPGRLNTTGVVTPFAGGSPAFFQIRIQDTTSGYYHGNSEIFQCTPGTSIAFNSLVNHGGTALSTWADGTYNMDFLGLGNRGAIEIVGTPEPTVGCLVLLASALFSRSRVRARRLSAT